MTSNRTLLLNTSQRNFWVRIWTLNLLPIDELILFIIQVILNVLYLLIDSVLISIYFYFYLFGIIQQLAVVLSNKSFLYRKKIIIHKIRNRSNIFLTTCHKFTLVIFVFHLVSLQEIFVSVVDTGLKDSYLFKLFS